MFVNIISTTVGLSSRPSTTKLLRCTLNRNSTPNRTRWLSNGGSEHESKALDVCFMMLLMEYWGHLGPGVIKENTFITLGYISAIAGRLGDTYQDIAEIAIESHLWELMGFMDTADRGHLHMYSTVPNHVTPIMQWKCVSLIVGIAALSADNKWNTATTANTHKDMGKLTDWFQLPDMHKGKEVLCDQKGSHYTLIDECIHEANSAQLSCREHRDSLISIRQSLSHRHYCFRDLRIGSAYNYERASETYEDGERERDRLGIAKL